MYGLRQRENHDIIPDNRKRIYDYIKATPGSHLRKISKELLIAIGDTQYHLGVLEKSGLVKSRRIGIYRVYYLVSILEGRQESILATLQQETPRQIIINIIEHPGATQREIADHMELSSPTINWHMSNLIKIGLVRCRKDRQFVKYYIEGDIEDIINLLKLYYPTLWDGLSSRLADLFFDLATSSTSYSIEIRKQTDINEKKQQLVQRKDKD